MRQRALLIAVSLAGCLSESIHDERKGCDDGLGISEVAAANEETNLASPAFCETHSSSWCCEHSDWAELHNGSSGPLDVSTYSLAALLGESRHPLALPEPLAPDERLIVVMHPFLPKDDLDCDRELGFPFAFGGVDLDRDGGTGVRLISSQNDECDGVAYPDQHADFTWSRQDDAAGGWCDTKGTPGEKNDSCLCSETEQC